MIDVSVVVVSWNTRELVLACLSALERELSRCAQTGKKGEVVLVDNGSRDGTPEAVRARFPAVSVIALDTNRGFAAGANLGIQSTEGQVVLLLNSDAEPLAGAIEACLRVLELRPEVAVAGAQLLHPDGRLQNSIHAFPSLTSELLPTWLLELAWPRRFPSKRQRRTQPCEVDAVLGAALFVRRSALEQVGSLSEDYFFFLEETDLCWRLKRAGWRVLHVPEARVKHAAGASSKRREPARTRIEFHRSLYHFMRVHRGPLRAHAVRLIRFLKGIGSVLLLALAAPFSARQRGRLGERWRLLLWHLRGCPEGWGLAALTAEPPRG